MQVVEMAIVTAMVGAAAMWAAARVWRFFTRAEASPCLGCNGACGHQSQAPRTIGRGTSSVNHGRGQHGRAVGR